MNSKGMMRKLAWTVGALVAFVAVAYLTLVVVNWNDEPPSADAERLVAMKRDRAQLADAGNGFVHALSLAAAPDADPVALGSARKAYIEEYVPSFNGDAVTGLPGEDVGYRAARSPEVAALANACSEASACMEALHADPEALVQWLASEQWLLDRYRHMLATEGWLEAIPTDASAPLAGYQHVMEAQKLHLLAVRQQALARDTVAVSELLERDLVFWREVLASSDLLISKMIAAAAVRRHFAFGNFALRELPPDLADAAVPPSWRQPLTVAERSIARALGGEWHFIGGALRMAMSPEAQAGDPGQRLADRLLRPLFKPQATLNLFAARMVPLGTLSELPYPEIGPSLERLAGSHEDASTRFRLYNPVGGVLEAVSAVSAYANYIARTADLEGQRRAALLVASLRGGGIGREGAATAVRDASLRNPYDDAPFEWDAATGSVVFRGLEEGDRGRHVLLF